MIKMNEALDQYYSNLITLDELKIIASQNGYELARFHGQIVPVQL